MLPEDIYLCCLYSYIITPLFSSSSSYIFHGVGPLLDLFQSHISRSLFKGLPWFLLQVGPNVIVQCIYSWTERTYNMTSKNWSSTFTKKITRVGMVMLNVTQLTNSQIKKSWNASIIWILAGLWMRRFHDTASLLESCQYNSEKKWLLLWNPTENSITELYPDPPNLVAALVHILFL